MYAVLENRFRLCVTLTKEDLNSLRISYQDLKSNHPRVRQVLAQIFKAAQYKTGFCPQQTKILIEAFPFGNEGCRLYFSAFPPSSQNPETDAWPPSLPVLFVFPDLETAAQAAFRLFGQYNRQVCRSSLFRQESSGEYLLVLYSSQAVDSAALALLTEYAQPVGEGPTAAAYAEEYGSPVILGNALDTLSLYLS